MSKQHVRCAEPIFEEAPIVVVSTDRTDANFERQRLFARFEAYTILGQMAEGGGQAAAQAISAFHELTPNGEMQPELVAAANAILDTNAPPELPAAQRTELLREITDVLMRFEMNQVGYNRGHDSSRVQASGLYILTSRLNHSCDANVSIQSKKAYCEQHGLPYSMAEEGDVLIAMANRDIHKGERLTINYVFGHDGFPGDWDVHRRRELLQRRGFKCACERCTAEAQDERTDVDQSWDKTESSTQTKSSSETEVKDPNFCPRPPVAKPRAEAGTEIPTLKGDLRPDAGPEVAVHRPMVRRARVAFAAALFAATVACCVRRVMLRRRGL